MAGYIGARSVSLSATVANAQDVTATDTTPEVTIINNTHEDTDGGREGKVIFKGQQSGGEESTLAEIQGSHDGTADDEKGDLIFRTNDGSDGASPTERLRIDSTGSISTATLGTDNVHLGEGAGASIVSGGIRNVLIGKDAGNAITTGDNNTFVGAFTGDVVTTGTSNTALGFASLSSCDVGNHNTAVGHGTLNALNYSSSTDGYNTAVGSGAGELMTTGVENTVIGSLAGASNTTSSGVTYVGRGAGNATTGQHNTFVGEGSGFYVTSGEKNTILGRYNGNQDSLDIRTSSNNIVLSDGDGKPRLSCTQYGVFSMRTDIDQGMYIFTGGTNNTNGKVLEFYDGDNHSCGSVRINQSANTVSYVTSSDYRLKENVTNLTNATTRLKQLQPKRFNFILDTDDTIYDGFLAHEVSSIVPEAISGDKDEVDTDGNPVYQGIDHSKLVPLLVATIQELEARIATLEAQNTTQATQIADLITRVEALEAE